MREQQLLLASWQVNIRGLTSCNYFSIRLQSSTRKRKSKSNPVEWGVVAATVDVALATGAVDKERTGAGCFLVLGV